MRERVARAWGVHGDPFERGSGCRQRRSGAPSALRGSAAIPPQPSTTGRRDGPHMKRNCLSAATIVTMRAAATTVAAAVARSLTRATPVAGRTPRFVTGPRSARRDRPPRRTEGARSISISFHYAWRSNSKWRASEGTVSKRSDVVRGARAGSPYRLACDVLCWWCAEASVGCQRRKLLIARGSGAVRSACEMATERPRSPKTVLMVLCPSALPAPPNVSDDGGGRRDACVLRRFLGVLVAPWATAATDGGGTPCYASRVPA